MPNAGDPAIDFTLADQDGREVRLSDFSGKTIVLYFYPRDNTPGCTREDCSFRDVHDELLSRGAVVIGISRDSTASHQRFREKQGLPFLLLSDPEAHAIQAWGAWGEKKMMGKAYMGILRQTFLIGPDFRIQKVFPKVSPDGHGGEILKTLESLASS